MSRCRLLANRRDAERFTIKNPSFTVWKKRHRQYGILVFAAWFLPPCGTKCQGCNLGASFFVVQNKLAHPHNSVKYAVAAARRKQFGLSHWHANAHPTTNPTGVQDVRELFQIAVSPVSLVSLVSPVSLVSLPRVTDLLKSYRKSYRYLCCYLALQCGIFPRVTGVTGVTGILKRYRTKYRW